MRRLSAILTLLMVAAFAAMPVLAGAETFHFRGSGNSASATYSNVPWDAELIPPGTYFYTDVWASESITTGGGDVFDTGGGGVCVFHETFTIDANGDWQEGQFIGACAKGADFSVARRLTGASLEAAIPVIECVEWGPEKDECIELVDLGTIMVDLAWTGEGPIDRYHGAGSGGSAGNYQYSSHGTGTSRAASPSGAVDLVAPDASVTDLTGGLAGDGYISRSQDGYMEVSITHGGY